MKHLFIYVSVLFITITACSKKESETTEHDHDHEEVKLNFTVYTDQFELFAETDPFVKGEKVEILAHLTRLPEFKPLKGGSITVSLINGSNSIKQTVDQPLRTGIYQFSLIPEVSGANKLIFDIQNKDANHQIIVNNVVVYDDENTADHIAEKKQIEQINSIAFTKEQSWKINFKTELPIEESFGKVFKTTAQVMPDQKSETLIIAKTNGIISFQRNILEGDVVGQGELLIGISGNSLANDNASVRFQEAKSNYDLTKSNYDRKLALSQNQIVSEKELEEAKNEYNNAKAVYENLNRNFNANGQNISVSKEGVVKHVFVENGQYVEAGDALISVISSDNLIVKAEIQQKYFEHLKLIYSANLKSTVNNKIYTLDELRGKFLSYGKSIDQNEGFLIPVYFQIKSTDEFLPGSFIEVMIKTNENKKSILVPNGALLEEQGTFYIFVQKTPELFEKREVVLGNSDGINTEILSGLDSTERIVSKGAIIVKLAAVSNSLDPHAGHVH